MKEVSVLLVGNYLLDQQQSMQRYAELLQRELTVRGWQAEIIRPEPLVGRLRPSANGMGKWLGYIDKFVLFPFKLRQLARDGRRLVHICDHSNAMYAAHVLGVPHVTTCHDLLAVRSALGHFSQNITGWSGRRLQSWIISGLRRSRRIICVSEETRRQLLAFPGFAGKAITVVGNGLNHAYRPLSVAEIDERLRKAPAFAKLAARPFVLFLGGTQWYKNRSGLLRIFAEYARLQPEGVDLLFAGKAFTTQDHQILAEMPSAVRLRIHHVGAPDNEQLNALYCRAACFLFPSLEEGFGWPIVEAMSCGCPVVTSGRPPMNEIAGQAAAYIDPLDILAATRVLLEVVNEAPEARNARVQAGLVQAAKFSTASMIDGIVENYQAILASVSRNGKN